MNKRAILAVVAIFISWSILDFIIHHLLLQSTYQATASLWRPEAEMKLPLMYLVTLIYSVGFVCIYNCLISSRSMSIAVQYGLVLGVTVGVSMGFGSYSYMPIPMSLAWSWFAATLVEHLVGGVLLGMMIKKQDTSC